MYQNTHGGNLNKISKLYGLQKSDIIDFSANINPLGISPLSRKIITSCIDDIINYPDPDCSELIRQISLYLNIPPKFILTGNGSSEIIFALFSLLKPRKILMPAPCFSEYIYAAKECPSQISFFKLYENNNFKLILNDFIHYIDNEIDTIILCNPNNPTSTLIPKNDLLKLIDFAESKNINIIIDEAFIELTIGGNQNSLKDFILKYKNLFIIRSLTKIIAIPGLRVGYILASPQILKRLSTKKAPWSVNTFACNIGKVLNEDYEYFKLTNTWLKTEIEWLYNELREIKYLKVFKPSANFILLKLYNTRYTSGSLQDSLLKKKILIRDASNFKFLNNHFFRIAIKDRENNIKLINALKEVPF